jgi:hypothetical protein
MRRSAVGLVFLSLALAGPASALPSTECFPGAVPQERAWTIAYYSMGDSDLEGNVIDDFVEIAKVGSSSNAGLRAGIHVVVQLDRKAPSDNNSVGMWSDTYRFYVRKGDAANPQLTESLPLLEKNMADGKTLTEFLQWTRKCYPAERFALIVNGHGYGARGESGTVDGKPVPSGMRALSTDLSNPNDVFYVQEFAEAIGAAFSDRKLDLIGLDACLMGTVEVAFALRDKAHVLVASEEIEDPSGWLHNLWLQKLSEKPSMDPAEVARTIVRSYPAGVPGSLQGQALLAAVRLAEVSKLTRQIDIFGDALRLNDQQTLAKVREACRDYGSSGNSVDVKCLAQSALVRAHPIVDTRELLKLLTGPESVVFEIAFADGRTGPNVPGGISIYFPNTRSAFEGDRARDGYLDSGPAFPGAEWFPIQFVQHHRWDQFLLEKYLK